MPDGSIHNYGYGYLRWFGNGYRAPWTLMPNPSMFVPLPSSWKAAVAWERAKRAARSKPVLSPSTQSELQALEAEVKAAYQYLRNAPAEEEKGSGGPDWFSRWDRLDRRDRFDGSGRWNGSRWRDGLRGCSHGYNSYSSYSGGRTSVSSLCLQGIRKSPFHQVAQ